VDKVVFPPGIYVLKTTRIDSFNFFTFSFRMVRLFPMKAIAVEKKLENSGSAHR